MKIDAYLIQLEIAELIRQLLEDDPSYIFKHALVQDTAYESILKQQRRQLHRAVGETIERTYPTQLDENASILAWHFGEGGENAKAVAYARRAAQYAVERYAYDAAIQQLRRALDLIHDTDPARPLILEELGDVHRLLGEGRRALALYREALSVWEKLAEPDKIMALRLHRKIVETLVDFKWAIKTSDFDIESRANEASVARIEAELPSQVREPQAETARLLTALSFAKWRIQAPPDWDAALRHAQTAVEIAEKLDDPVELSASLDALGSVLFARGHLREHLRVAQWRFTLNDTLRLNDERQRLDSVRGMGSALAFVGEYARAIPHLLHAEEIAGRLQAVNQQFNARSLLSLCCLRLDRWDDVLQTELRVRDLASRYPRERIGPT
jgi:tetratricopeptide (TPR) repeat protein